MRSRPTIDSVVRALTRALAGAVALIGATRSTATAQPEPDSSGYITSADGARLYFAIYGSSRDTVIVPAGVLLASPLYPLHESLTLVFYDPRGRGRSDWIADPKRLTMADEVRDLETVRSALRISRAGLLGFSYLGLMTALYAADHPGRVTRFAQLGPVSPDEETASHYRPPEGRSRLDSAAVRLARARAAAVDTSDFAADCHRYYDAYLPVYLGDPGNAVLVATDYCSLENESPARFLWRNDRVMRSLGRNWDFTRKAASIRVPTLVVQGDRDFAVSPDGARKWAELIPDARLIMLAGAGHLAYVERADRVLTALTRFFLGSWPPESMQLRTSR
jgi:pimeloyl-ACP methyl ester carboxylesterase